MEATMIEYERFYYLVQPISLDNFYGRKAVYHVLTNNPKWCGSLIPQMCGYNNVISEGEYKYAYEKNPSLETALKPYYRIDFIESDLYKDYDLRDLLPFEVDQDSYYQFTYIEPYDD